jgi:hypothetical protein
VLTEIRDARARLRGPGVVLCSHPKTPKNAAG